MLARPLQNTASIARGLSRAASVTPCFLAPGTQSKEQSRKSCQPNLLAESLIPNVLLLFSFQAHKTVCIFKADLHFVLPSTE